MTVVRLLPINRVAPSCESFSNAAAVRAYERAVRVHRAFTEPFTITAVDGRPDGAYRVAGAARGAYAVDIVDASGRHDACTCPDFLVNELGTCKHIEAVRRALQAGGRGRPARGRVPATATVPTLTVAADGTLGLRVCGEWTYRQLAALGLSAPGARNLVTVRDGAVLAAGVQEDGVRIVHAAPAAAARVAAREARARRAAALSEALGEDRAGVDVLAQPLFPYQRTGVAHLAVGGRALLADDMGLGKTVQAIAACEVLRGRGEAQRVVVVTPASLKHQWAKEVERYAGRRAVVVAGRPRMRREAFASDAPYKILSYEMTLRELANLRDLAADVLILDEAQRAKNFRTRTAATLRAIPSRFLFVLTGTPVENRLDDLYALLQLIDEDALGPLWRFNLEFHEQNHKGRVIGYKNLALLRERLAPYVLRRRKEEVLTQLPPLTEQTRYVAMTKEQEDLESDYRAAAARYAAMAEKRPLTPLEIKKMLAALLKARQACNALELCDPASKVKASGKLDELAAVVSEIAAQGNAKILVFSEWVEMLKLAAARLDTLGIGWTMLHGGVPSDKRPALLDRFRTSTDERVLLSSDAGGVGLNLQVANYVIHLDLPWNPARLDQRTSRAHRLGQTRGVSVTYLCSETGIERGIEGTLAGKRAVRSAALDPTSDVEQLDAPSFAMFMRDLREVLEVAETGHDIEVLGEEVEAAPAAETGTREPARPAAAAATPGGEQLAAEPPAAPTAPATPPPGDGTPAGEAAVGAPPPAQPVDLPAAPVPGPARPGAGGVASQEGQRTTPPLLPGEPPVAGALPGGAAPRERAANRLRLARVVLDAGFAGDAVRAAYEALAAAIAALLDGVVPVGHTALVAAIYRDLIPAGRLPHAAPGALARLHDLTALGTAGVDVDTELARGAVAEAEAWIARLAPVDDAPGRGAPPAV
jgi:superfamily II DNA or RNA helicase